MPTFVEPGLGTRRFTLTGSCLHCGSPANYLQSRSPILEIMFRYPSRSTPASSSSQVSTSIPQWLSMVICVWPSAWFQELRSPCGRRAWSPRCQRKSRLKVKEVRRAAARVNGPTLPNQRCRHYVLDITGMRRNAKVHVVFLRKPLLVLCDLVDHDHDVYFVNGMSWAKHRVSQELVNITRRVGSRSIAM